MYTKPKIDEKKVSLLLFVLCVIAFFILGYLALYVQFQWMVPQFMVALMANGLRQHIVSDSNDKK